MSGQTNSGDGGPVFPHPQSDGGGMSLRDWFAGQALTGYLAAAGHFGCADDDRVLATRCYQRADAMLAERAKGGG